MIIVTGTPGSGKSTLIKSFAKKFNIINYGTVMFEIAKKNKVVKTRDELRYLPYEKQIMLQKKTARKISKMNKKNMILDTHAVVSTPKGYYPGLSKESLEILNPDILIFIYVPFKELKERIIKDKKRQRKEFLDRKKVEEVIDISKIFLASYVVHCNAKLAFIDNSGPVGSAVPEMKKILE